MDTPHSGQGKRYASRYCVMALSHGKDFWVHPQQNYSTNNQNRSRMMTSFTAWESIVQSHRTPVYFPSKRLHLAKTLPTYCSRCRAMRTESRSRNVFLRPSERSPASSSIWTGEGWSHPSCRSSQPLAKHHRERSCPSEKPRTVCFGSCDGR